ncbi:inositol monophosphatase family protein [Paenibacillus lautus]|uniref:inositol monophosphatase family protein n=1 Tax=Paenibacillus lautus TaxID=1401 RepID=UPI003D2C44B9
MKDKALEWAIFAEKIVRLAGKKITKLQTQSLIEVTYKNAGELVTSADFASDQIIREAITSAYPEHGILSEENTDGYGTKDNFEGPHWIIDPLDGTVNYAHRLPHFAVSAAIAVDGMVWAGVVYAPDLGVTYVGIRGKGAFWTFRCSDNRYLLCGIRTTRRTYRKLSSMGCRSSRSHRS